MICRSLDKQPTGIHLANKGGICVENIGDFDKERDMMTEAQKNTIITLTGSLLKKFSITPNSQTLVYHHWFDLETGKRKVTDEPDSIKTCPGTNFFGGNTVKAYNDNFLPSLNKHICPYQHMIPPTKARIPGSEKRKRGTGEN